MARINTVRKSYVYANGETSRSARPGWTALRFETLKPEKVNDQLVVVDTIDVTREELSGVHDEMLGHGGMQKIGDNLAGIEKKVLAEGSELPSWDDDTGWAPAAKVLIEDMVDNLRNGVWVEEGEGTSGGGNVTILLEAVERAYREAGIDWTDEVARQVSGTLRENKEMRDKTRKTPAVAKHITIITAERAQARADKAKQQEAGDASGLQALFTGAGAEGGAEGGADGEGDEEGAQE